MISRTALAAVLVIVPMVAGAQVTQAELRQRRDSVLTRTGDGIVLALGSPEPAEDYLSFFQNPAFHYLTGLREPEAALVMVRRGSERTSMLFVQPRNPAEEVWTGSRLGVDGVTQTMGMRGRDYAELPRVMDSLLSLNLPLNVIGDYSADVREVMSADDQLVRSLIAKRQVTVRSANGIVNELRRRKSPTELDFLRKSIALTVEAHREAMRLVEPGMNEFEVQALIEYTFRRYGADRPGFATIVGSGPNATTLHYNADDRFMKAGEVVVMDIGAAYRGYSADVTRTIPVSGTFTPEQRAIYQIVRDAQAAAEAAATPGARRQALATAASRTLGEGLAKLGLIEAPGATYECGDGDRKCSQLSLYYMHGLGHDIGLDVHDPNTPTIAVGSAFTIEPGIYVRENTIDIIPDRPGNRALRDKLRPLIERYQNIGVRIEDDYFVTEQGLEWISRAPREIAEIEALMKGPFTGPSPRDPVKVEWYRGGGG